MAGSIFGTHFRIETFGESHGEGLGVVIDGCPAGLSLCAEDIQIYLNRRKPGQSKFTTPRKEADAVEILSGVFEGKTTGTPIALLVRNTSQRSSDYSEIASYYRPGHADFTFDAKYGQTTQSKINQIFHQLYGELIIVFLAGIVLASSIHYFLSHYRRAHRKALEPKPVVKINKITNTLNFHRRRKRFVK